VSQKKSTILAEALAAASAIDADLDAPPLPSPDTVFNAEAEFASLPPDVLDLLERRLLDPETPGSVPIRLRDEPVGGSRKWHLRWVNTAIPNRYHQVTQGLGYVPVRWDELVSRDDVSDRFEASPECVARGEKGVERLLKMPLRYFTAIKRAQEARRLAKDTPKQLKEDLQRDAAAAASTLDPRFGGISGDEAAAVAGSLVGDITVGRERLVGG
jgi:hypothetical protein